MVGRVFNNRCSNPNLVLWVDDSVEDSESDYHGDERADPPGEHAPHVDEPYDPRG